MPPGEFERCRTSTVFKARTQLAPAGLTEPNSLSCSQGPSWLSPHCWVRGWVGTEGLALCQESRTQHKEQENPFALPLLHPPSLSGSCHSARGSLCSPGGARRSRAVDPAAVSWLSVLPMFWDELLKPWQ